MDTLEAIATRRSIRKYTAQAVGDDLVEQILKAGMMAPSARNEQAWQFVVVRRPETLQALSQVSPYAATQNMLLAAHALGLGCVWVAVYPREERIAALRQVLPLPDPIVPLCLLPLGYPAESRAPVERFDPARIHREQW